MTWVNTSRLSKGTALALVFPIMGAFTLPANAQSILPLPSSTTRFEISLNFKPPKKGAPPVTAGGAARGRCMQNQKRSLTSLTPKGEWALTLAARPSFYVYIPPSPAKTANFLLLGDNDRTVVYETNFKLPNQTGIVRFDLPENAPALEVGKEYHWHITVLCESTKGPSGNPTVDGWVERVKPSATLTSALKTAQLARQPDLYAEAGLWNETLSSLFDLHGSRLTRFQAAIDWKKLLQSTGLESIANEPLVDCCKSEAAGMQER